MFVETTDAVEDYLKAIFHLSAQGGEATTGAIAQRLGVSPPSVSAMVKRLVDGALAEKPRSRSVRLTERGEQVALRVVRRHRLLETFLAEVLAVPWDEVHAEAEVLEHAVSDRLEERIDATLGHPTRDPHGDPIPPRLGRHREEWGSALEEAAPGTCFRVERVSDRDSGALRYLGQLGVVPGALVQVDRREPFGGPLWVRVEGRRHALGVPLTRLVHGRGEETPS